MGITLDLKNCSGTLKWNDSHIQVVFHTSTDSHGTVNLTFERLELSDESLFLNQVASHRGRTFQMVELDGSHSEGATLHSPAVYFTDHEIGFDRDGSYIALVGTTRSLEVDLPRTGDRTCDGILEYWVPGLSSFSVPHVDTPGGSFAIRSSLDPDDVDAVNGAISIKTASGDLEEQEDIEDQVSRLLDVLSLANGRIIQWSVRKAIQGERARILFRGPMRSGERLFSLFPDLHLGPAVRAALFNYTTDLRNRTGLHAAIVWSLMNGRYTESRVLTDMTALEHLLFMYAENGFDATFVDKVVFRTCVRPSVEDAIKSVASVQRESISQPIENELLRRVGNLNSKSLRVTLEAFLRHHAVPVEDISTQIPTVIELRNEIIHQGQAAGPDLDRLDNLSVILHELLGRIFLSLLDYTGPYLSHLNGPEIKQFKRT